MSSQHTPTYSQQSIVQNGQAVDNGAVMSSHSSTTSGPRTSGSVSPPSTPIRYSTNPCTNRALVSSSPPPAPPRQASYSPRIPSPISSGASDITSTAPTNEQSDSEAGEFFESDEEEIAADDANDAVDGPAGEILDNQQNEVVEDPNPMGAAPNNQDNEVVHHQVDDVFDEEDSEDEEPGEDWIRLVMPWDQPEMNYWYRPGWTPRPVLVPPTPPGLLPGGAEATAFYADREERRIHAIERDHDRYGAFIARRMRRRRRRKEMLQQTEINEQQARERWGAYPPTPGSAPPSTPLSSPPTSIASSQTPDPMPPVNRRQKGILPPPPEADPSSSPRSSSSLSALSSTPSWMSPSPPQQPKRRPPYSPVYSSRTIPYTPSPSPSPPPKRRKNKKSTLVLEMRSLAELGGPGNTISQRNPDGNSQQSDTALGNLLMGDRNVPGLWAGRLRPRPVRKDEDRDEDREL
ncbi:hypothetical protein B0T20DRAFT_474143 [Sordaria brevicollis]|uniref:Uncharacterized protein n=1 Tax=Sordaria brevicollis TaxID=83679 RepID=A0AAE0U0F8_SORBR|nr:hypothetical protein B0T20DRAFT_474143 [Sordaria brevicollis]